MVLYKIGKHKSLSFSSRSRTLAAELENFQDQKLVKMLFSDTSQITRTNNPLQMQRSPNME